MSIVFHETTGIFHLFNQELSYIMMILPNGHLGQLYCGRRIADREDFSYLLELAPRDMASYLKPDDRTFSLGHVKLEYGVYGSGDYRRPALMIRQADGSSLCDFRYESHEIRQGKPRLEGLPATYTEQEDEAQTLTVTLRDPVTQMELSLSYTLFAQGGILARSARLINRGSQTAHLLSAMSLCLDLPDHDYEWLQFSGAWARERWLKKRSLEYGVLAVDSARGHSSHEQNPFIVLKRPSADEFQGEVMGFSLVYSGNFLAQAEVESHGTTRILLGINPFCFDWKLDPGESFQTPEAVLVYSHRGLNDMSQTFHRLFQRRLARGFWRDRPRPILINNWEATYFDFTEERLLELAEKARSCGVELFVLDDGWFGKRSSSRAGLGDWTANRERLPDGLAGLAEKINALGMAFGLWIEPEMVNADSDLYRAHPDWILRVPGRTPCHGRYQFVLDFSRPEIVDYLYERISALLEEANIAYLKWDMNRSITDCYSAALPADRQGEVFHRYILGVYRLYERLHTAFPQVLFESCASGGARFDAGMLYYAPQGWISDDTDAAERLKIQYGTSFCYPPGSMGSHVSASPNHQLMRSTPLWTRANVAYFGTFGYELDLCRLTEDELEEIRGQIRLMKEYRALFQFGTFYRLLSPFEGDMTAWMSVDEARSLAIAGWYRTLNTVNGPFLRLRLRGLDPDRLYRVTRLPDSPGSLSRQNAAQETQGAKQETKEASAAADRAFLHRGDELMYLGLLLNDASAGQFTDGRRPSCDFDSCLYLIQEETGAL